MELKELPKDKKEELTKQQKDDLFISLLRGKDVTEKVETTRGIFELKFPRMIDLEKIGRIMAFRQNGLPTQCFDPNVLALMNEIATLDVLVVSGPAWYENIKKENEDFTWQDIPDQNFIQEVYAKAYEFRLKVQKIFNKPAGKENSGMDNTGSNEDSNGPDLFEGLSGSAGTAR